jgi:hypothetical protein
MFDAEVAHIGGVRTGNPALDRLVGISGGIITLRSRSIDWLSCLASNIIVRSHIPGTSTLYVHWVDYYKRFWTVDLDLISRTAKRLGRDVNSIMDGVHFIRMFSRDSVEAGENWERIYSSGGDVGLAVLDSVSELFEDGGGRRGRGNGGSRKGGLSRAYSIGRFSRLCMMNGCPGIVLDTGKGPIHPYLGEVSSVVLDFFFRGRLLAKVLKHPCMANMAVEISRGSQASLRSWLP